ncbi:MAG TPA: hypothetical protein VMV17_08840 [Streptosporangiaceae bacterium]|nr:hypothetical protein [Streptosporangiaceae bacterium]
MHDAPGTAAARRPVPLRRRRVDWVLLAFFAVNLCFITYFVDIEQLTVASAAHFHYPPRSTPSSAATNGSACPR